MKRLISITCRYGNATQCPNNRISANKIIGNLQSQPINHKIINNIIIGINCTKIALKYSKCYLCRFPFIKNIIRTMYKMEEDESILKQVKQLMQMQVPINHIKTIFPYFKYQNKGLYSSLSLLLLNDKLTLYQQQQAIKFLTALESVNLGFILHYSIGKPYKLNILSRIILKLMSKRMKDSYLVLAGDYYHIKASVLASQTYNIRLSKLLSEVEIDLTKYIHLTDQLKTKIAEQGYHSVQVKEIFNISLLKISPLVKGLMSMDIIRDRNPQQLKQAYQCLSLIVLYRKDLENFMFNFKQIVKIYMQNKNTVYEESLPYFIFYKGAHNQRIDTAYLNTVTMMNQQIQYLKQCLQKIIGKENTQHLEKRMNYFMMVQL